VNDALEKPSVTAKVPGKVIVDSVATF